MRYPIQYIFRCTSSYQSTLPPCRTCYGYSQQFFALVSGLMNCTYSYQRITMPSQASTSRSGHKPPRTTGSHDDRHPAFDKARHDHRVLGGNNIQQERAQDVGPRLIRQGFGRESLSNVNSDEETREEYTARLERENMRLRGECWTNTIARWKNDEVRAQRTFRSRKPGSGKDSYMRLSSQ